MSIEHTRAEILRLIGRLGEGASIEVGESKPDASSRRSESNQPAQAGGQTATRAHRARLDRHQARLASLRSQRDRLAHAGRPAETSALPDGLDLGSVLARIEKRIAAVETQLGTLATPQATRPSAASPDYLLAGELRDGLLSDLLQLVSSNEWSGVFVVGQGAEEIKVEFAAGEIWNASGPGAKGEEAVYALMARVRGRYFFRETAEAPAKRTIEGNTQFLILEGLRRLDEAGAGSTEE